MKKWLMLMSTGLVLTACGTTEQENEAPAETEETAEVESGDSQSSSNTESQSQETTETDSVESETTQSKASNASAETPESSNPTQSIIDEARTQLNEGKTDQAALTVRTLEEQNEENLTEEETNQVEELKRAIDNDQAAQAENNQSSNYQEVRESTVLNENYQESTGENFDDASDGEVETWLNEEETADSQNSSQQNSDNQDQSQNQNSSSDQPTIEQELENYALEQVTAQTGLLSENYTYFTDLQEDNWVQVEIREQHSDGEVGWTTMVGFYRYNVETDTLETMDPITGEFN